MVYRFLESPRHLVSQFEIEARRCGAKFIEAEHMLLALAGNSGSDAGTLLSESGLDHDRLAAALQDEQQRSLAFAGVRVPDEALGEATKHEAPLSLGTSAKVAFMRALRAMIASGNHRRGARLKDVDLLRGILLAELGTVPRALAIAGVDREMLISRINNKKEVATQPC